MNPQELKSIMGSGLLSFPLTDFDAEGNFDKKGYIERLEWLAPYGASALFAAGGTGEFFSLTADEYPGIIETAVQTCRGKVPIIAGAGGPTRFAIQCAQAAEKAGAHGILLLPHYLTEAGQEGLAAHVEAVCKSVKFGVIVYNRGQSRLYPETLAKLAERCPNLVGFKDGIGDIELMVSIFQRMGERRIGLDELESLLRQGQLLEERRGRGERHDRRADVVDEAGMSQLGRTGAAADRL